MTVTSQTPRSGPYTGNGSATSFSYTFRVDLEAELVVIREEGGVESTLTLDTHYTVTGVEAPSGGTVEMITAPTTDQTLTIYRSVTQQQTIDLQNRKSVVPQVLEDGLDELTRMMQDQSERLDRVPMFPISGSLTGLNFPAPSGGLPIGWNAAGDGLANISGLPTATLSASADTAILTYDLASGGIQDSNLVVSGTTLKHKTALGTFDIEGLSQFTSLTSMEAWAANFYVKNAAGDETMLHADADGSVDLYYDNVKKLGTDSNGASVFGSQFLQEQAAAAADKVAYGQLWVKNTTPNELWFTDDAGTDFQISDTEALRADTDDNLTAGYTSTADDDGTKSSGTYTPDPAGGNLKRIVNGGAFTLAAPTATGDYTLIIQMTNNATAGAITLSGFTRESGDALTTTNGDDFFLHIVKLNGFTTIYAEALQ